MTDVRYSDFHALDSSRDSVGCVNGKDHRITEGDLIGWSRKYRLACCQDCWNKWVCENDEAAMYESGCWD